MLKPYHTTELTFDIINEIGQDGRNSRTYQIYDHQLNANIVTKQIKKSSLNSPSDFFSESQALYASAHPNVVQIHYACFDQEYIYVAMPYYKKGSVKDLMSEQYLTVRQIITLGAQVLTGLHNIHSKNLIHFDVKPDNILLSPRGEALISDFGQAKQMNFAGTATQDRHYSKMIPPEALVTDVFDCTFDIYQFGLTLYRMCNGNEDFYYQFSKYGEPQNFDRAQFRFDLNNGRFPDRSSFLPHIPSTLRTVIKKCLNVDPTQRYKSAVEVGNALSGIDGNCLDWQHTPLVDKKVWTKSEKGTEYELTINNADNSSVCYKSLNGGARRRVNAICKASITDRELRNIFTDY